MEKYEQENYECLGMDYWWLRGKYEIVQDLMRRHCSTSDTEGSAPRVLDVGCGPGNMIGFLKEFGTVSGLDPSPDAVQMAQEKGYADLTVAPIESTPYPDGFFDIVVAIDVLEHCRDDEKALKEIHRVLKNGGHLVWSVPAYRALWGDHDELYGHHRRYTKAEKMAKLARNGFASLDASYIEPIFVAPLFLFRKGKRFLGSGRDDFVRLPKFLNTALTRLIASEKYILRFISIPFGVSLVGVAQKHGVPNTV